MRFDSIEEVREALRARFEALLDQALVGEDAPRGLAGEFMRWLEDDEPEIEHPACDRHALWSALIALTQEVKLQGRAFRSLQETLAPLEALSERDAVQEQKRLQEAVERGRGELLEPLLDLRDRLRRGESAARAHLERARAARGWTPWRRPGRVLKELIAATEAFVTGYRLSLDRLDATLEALGVVEIPCEGRQFDPHKMKAVDLAEARGVAAGTVLEVYRTGYERLGALLRAAEVKVAAPGGGG